MVYTVFWPNCSCFLFMYHSVFLSSSEFQVWACEWWLYFHLFPLRITLVVVLLVREEGWMVFAAVFYRLVLLSSLGVLAWTTGCWGLISGLLCCGCFGVKLRADFRGGYGWFLFSAGEEGSWGLVQLWREWQLSFIRH
jgi:hypothetical protein